MTIRYTVIFVAAALMLGAQNPPTIQKTRVNPTSPASGKDMYVEYCAVCHGKDGKGDGPAATALKKAPADLTTLAAHNGGKFPDLRVYGFIQGSNEVAVAAHGTRDMPMWGNVFNSMQHEQAVTAMRLSNLVDYIKSMQK